VTGLRSLVFKSADNAPTDREGDCPDWGSGAKMQILIEIRRHAETPEAAEQDATF
jgi:hypothetical protein